MIVALKLGEPRQPISPASRGLHRDGEQSVEELDVLSIRGGGGRVRSTELWRHRDKLLNKLIHRPYFLIECMHYSDLDLKKGYWAYLAVVEVTGCAVGIRPEQSGEQTKGWGRRRPFCLQGALWFGRQTASAPL